jgi:hypothetical protein
MGQTTSAFRAGADWFASPGSTQRDIYHIVMHNRLRPAIVPLDNDTTPGVLSDGAGVAYVILLMDASANSQLSRLVAGHGHSFFTERHSRFF